MTSRFQPGQSGNPAGRPRGIPNPQARLRKAIEQHVPAILDRLVAAALDGDVAAASLLLSRALAPLRPEALTQTIDNAGETIAERAEAVAQATLAGEVPTSAAADLMAVLQGQARIKELAELEARIAALESRS